MGSKRVPFSLPDIIYYLILYCLTQIGIELKEVCCEPDSMYSHKIKAEQRYYNWLENELNKKSEQIPDYTNYSPKKFNL